MTQVGSCNTDRLTHQGQKRNYLVVWALEEELLPMWELCLASNTKKLPHKSSQNVLTPKNIYLHRYSPNKPNTLFTYCKKTLGNNKEDKNLRSHKSPDLGTKVHHSVKPIWGRQYGSWVWEILKSSPLIWVVSLLLHLNTLFLWFFYLLCVCNFPPQNISKTWRNFQQLLLQTDAL